MPTHKYEVDQKLLCFEPDDSKAKVIYLAKILKRIPKRSSTPYYMVHFQGWKGRWDREVPENLLLENNEFNRTLKKKIDEVVRNVRCRLKRKQRIDQILEFASVCGDEIDWEKIPGIWAGRRINKQPKSETDFTNLKESYTSSERTEKVTIEDSISNSTHDDDDSLQTQYEQLQVHQAFRVSIDLPPGLQAILRALDTETVSQNVGWSSVLQLLQSYVDGFPYVHTTNVLPKCQGHCSDRAQRILGSAYLQTDQNRLLCVDVCSSLRVLFDLNVGSCQQHCESLATISFGFSNEGRAYAPGQHVPPTTEPMFRYSSPRYELLPEVEAARTPDLPCLNYPAGYLLRIFPALPQLLDNLTMSECKRTIVTRHIYLLLDYLERTRLFWFTSAKRAPHSDSRKVDTKTQLHASSARFVISNTASESSTSTEPLAQSTELPGRVSRSRRRGVCYTAVRSILNPGCDMAHPSTSTLLYPVMTDSRLHERPVNSKSSRSPSGSLLKSKLRPSRSSSHSTVTQPSTSRTSATRSSINNRILSTVIHIDRSHTRRSHTLKTIVKSKTGRARSRDAETSPNVSILKKRALRPRT